MLTQGTAIAHGPAGLDAPTAGLLLAPYKPYQSPFGAPQPRPRSAAPSPVSGAPGGPQGPSGTSLLGDVARVGKGLLDDPPSGWGSDLLRKGGNLWNAATGGHLNAAMQLGPGAISRALPIAAEYGALGPGAELFGSMGVPGATPTAASAAAPTLGQVAAWAAPFAAFVGGATALRGISSKRRADALQDLRNHIRSAEHGDVNAQNILAISAAQNPAHRATGFGPVGWPAEIIMREAGAIGAPTVYSAFGTGGNWRDYLPEGASEEGFLARAQAAERESHVPGPDGGSGAGGDW